MSVVGDGAAGIVGNVGDVGFQHLYIGQWVPMSPPATLTYQTALTVHSFDVDHWLLWSKPDSSWSWQLSPDGQGGTRLVTRIHGVCEWKTHPLMALFGVLLMEFGDFAMLGAMFARYQTARRGTRPRVARDRE